MTTQPDTAAQVQRLFADLAPRYLARTAGSRDLAERHRPHHAEVRSAGRFAPGWKELVYPIVCPRSAGSRLWDVDGNEYVDLTLGFGVGFFGHQPAFVADAVHERLALGVHLGAENELAGEVAERLTALVGMDRAAFVNTGSEAVVTALRLARAVTGRNGVAMFSGSYHGWYDAVLAEPSEDSDGHGRPAARGVPAGAVHDTIVLPYDDPASIAALRRSRDRLAAILVEPVQARRPGHAAPAFLAELRAVADEIGAALIFDEMVTGFRLAAGGAQQWFGIRADIGAYGKVLGGGMPIGAIAGGARYLDAIDGGSWGYGDASAPTADRTVFAGTFSRHPLAMVAARAVLTRIRDAGPRLYDDVNARTTRFAADLQRVFNEAGAPLTVTACGSLFRIDTGNRALRELLAYHLVSRGVFVSENRTGFLSTEHTDADCRQVVDAARDALEEIRGAWDVD